MRLYFPTAHRLVPFSGNRHVPRVGVMLSRFAPLRIALSEAKGLTVNFAKHPVLLEAIYDLSRFFAALRMTASRCVTLFRLPDGSEDPRYPACVMKSIRPPSMERTCAVMNPAAGATKKETA